MSYLSSSDSFLVPTVISGTVVGSGGSTDSLEIGDLMFALDTEVGTGGKMTILSEGKADMTNIKFGGSMEVSNGGLANRTNISSGGVMTVMGNANRTTLLSGGRVSVGEGARIDAFVQSSGGALIVTTGKDVQISGTNRYGDFSVSGNTAKGVVLENGGAMNLTGAATVTSALVENGGSLALNGSGMTAVAESIEVRNGGVALFNNTKITLLGVANGGSATVQSNSLLHSAVIGSGGLLSIQDGSASAVIQQVGGRLHVNLDRATVSGYNAMGIFMVSNGSATNFLVGSNVKFDVNFSGALAINTSVWGGGRMTVAQGGASVNTLVTSGANLAVGSAGYAAHSVVTSGGKMTAAQFASIGGGIMLGGTLTLTLGAFVMPETTIQFMVSQRTTSDSAMLVNMNVISDTTNKNNVAFSMTVDYEQKAGSYILASNASSFAHSISLYDSFGRSYGALSVGKTITAYDRTFTLKLVNNELSLIVGGEPRKSNPLVFGNFTGSNVTNIAVTLPDGAVGVIGTGYIGQAASPWKIVFAGDFNGDGTDDLLLRNSTTGDVASWLLKDGKYQQATGVGLAPEPWNILGVGDFNGDGTSDVLLQNQKDGTVCGWLLKDGTYSSAFGAGQLLDSWKFSQIGDFNGDGTSDILLLNQKTGEVAAWIMDDGRLANVTGVGGVSGNWTIAGTGDFNGDGTSDVLLWDTENGGVSCWLLENGTYKSATGTGYTAPGWSIVGIGDFNGDGTDDVALQMAGSDEVYAWILQDGQYKDAIRLA